MKRSAPPKRYTRIRSWPKTPRRPRPNACRGYLDWLKEQPCQITWRRTGAQYEVWDAISRRHWWSTVVVDPAHVRVKRLGGDLNNALSLAHHLHEELHQHGIKTFENKYGVNLKELAVKQTEQFLAEYPEVAHG